MFHILWGLLSVGLWVVPAYVLDTDDIQDPDHYLNSFLIQTDSREVALQVAREHNFELLDEIEDLKMYHLYHPEVSSRSKRSADQYVDKLKSDSRVTFAEQQITLRRVKRTHQVLHDKQVELPIREIKDPSLFYRVPVNNLDTRGRDEFKFNDKLYKDQWYLKNDGQTGGKRYMDMNVEPAWDSGYTGKGIVITILDDGIDHGHPDLKRNYLAEASADMNDENDVHNDPLPDKTRRGNSHGTRCAGEIAAEANNGVCGVGIAYEASIGGIRILDGRVTDRLEAKALLYKNQLIHIFTASWGPHDDGRTMEAPKQACSDALKLGAEKGRGGKGSIFVWATGNGGGYNDTCAADGYVNSIYSISTGSLSDQGEIPFYMEQCCSTMTVLPTGGEPTKAEEYRDGKFKIKVVTTDIDDLCTENFEGTSSAAPLGGGALGLVLQANPNLNWREVQHVVAMGSRLPSTDYSMMVNGAGFHVSRKFGFGMMDVGQMVLLAQEGINLPEQHECKTEVNQVDRQIPNGECTSMDFEFDACSSNGDQRISNAEHVVVRTKMSTGRRGNIEIYLTAPCGTESWLLSRRGLDDSSEDFEFSFMSVHHWMENPKGTWTLRVCDNPQDQAPSNSVLQSWQMTVYGFFDPSAKANSRAYRPSEEKQKKWIEDELNQSKRVVLKRAQGGILASKKSNVDQPQAKENLKDDRSLDSLVSLLVNYFDKREMDDGLTNSLFGNSDYLSNRNLKEKTKGKATAHNFKRGFNTHVYNSEEEEGEEVNVGKKEFESNFDDEIDLLTRDITTLLEDIENEKASEKQGNSNTYLDEYLNELRRLEHQKRFNNILRRVVNILEERK